MTLQVGDKAPDFTGMTQDRRTLSLADFAGQKLVLFFYPKDYTPSCTKQVCNLRDNYEALQAKGYVAVGVSKDSVDSHKSFASKYHLSFPLIADEDETINERYGTLRKFWFPRRTTFIIDEKGYITHIIDSVKVVDHASQILEL